MRLSLVWRFGLAAFALTLALGAGLTWLLHHAVTTAALGNARAEARDTVARRLLTNLQPSDLAGPLSGDRLDAFDRVVHGSILSDRTARVIIWDARGWVLYSDRHEAIGQIVAADTQRDAALHGRTVSELIAGRSAAGAGLDGRGDLLDVYTPIVFPSSPVPAGVFEIYQVYAPVAAQISDVQRYVMVGLGAGLLILYIVLLEIVRSGARTIQRQRDDLGRALVERSRAEDAHGRLAAILEATPDIVVTLSEHGRVLYANSAGRRALGVAPDDDLSSDRFVDYCPDWSRELIEREALPTAAREGAWAGEAALLHADGHEIPLSHVILAHKSAAGTVEFYSCVGRDISERKQFEEQLVHLASHDALTGLYNRRRFVEEVERALSQARRNGTQGALLFLDLDEFKGVNDSLGHRAGDQLLVSLAGVLRHELRDADVLARLGGDEFAILLAGADGQQAQTVATRILDAVRHHTTIVDGELVRTTTSIGVALFPDHGSYWEDLLVSADLAMYQAKALRDRCCVYVADSDARATVSSHRAWEQRIRDALEQNRLVLHAQAIQDLRTGACQYELLLRLVDEDGTVVMPGAFLDIAERSGAIRAIDRWVVQQAIRLIAERRRSGHHLCLEVNLSGKAFADQELLRTIEYELAMTAIDPSALVLEITETAAIADIDQAQRFISRLKALGCRFALDDFGVGFCSFYYLKHLPVDYLKIDGSFIRNLPRDPQDQHLVRAMVEVARGLGKQTIAEFVGDEDTAMLLRSYGVDFAQGYYIDRPRPVGEILGGMNRFGRATA